MMTLGERLVLARKISGDALGLGRSLSQSELARRAGVSQQAISAIEKSDDANRAASKLPKIASGLVGVSWVWLATGKGEASASPSSDQNGLPIPAGPDISQGIAADDDGKPMSGDESLREALLAIEREVADGNLMRAAFLAQQFALEMTEAAIKQATGDGGGQG